MRDITHQKKIRRFDLYVFPEIGQKPIGEVKSPEVFAVIRPLIIKKNWKLLTGYVPTSAPFTHPPSPMVLPTTIRPKRLLLKSRRKRRSTTPRLPSLKKWASYCGTSRTTKAHSWCNPR
ncbi:phage integrase central domain-containing protein [Methylomonas koyamae]|uniref:phage integrase central domain-containing protein n=1 Tax=Methylomonas koyamae TaxID=702114 RepID=UPI00391C68CA